MKLGFWCLIFLMVLSPIAAGQTKPDQSDPLGIDDFLNRQKSQQKETDKPSERIAIWRADNPNCGRFAIDGVYYYTIAVDGVTTAMTFKDTGDYLVARIIVLNHSDKDT